MRNQDRQDNILNTLASRGPMTTDSLQAWLGNPYRFEHNMTEMVADGRLAEKGVSRGGFNITVVYFNSLHPTK